VERKTVSVTVAYADVDGLKLLAARHGALVEEETYGSSVQYRLAVPAPGIERFRAAVAELTQGRARVESA
jgi:putative IMPACT (imprinted ancient) family translation regulator